MDDPTIDSEVAVRHLTAVHFFRGDRHGVVVVDDESALMVAAAAGGNGFRTELRRPTVEELEEFLRRADGPGSC